MRIRAETVLSSSNRARIWGAAEVLPLPLPDLYSVFPGSIYGYCALFAGLENANRYWPGPNLVGPAMVAGPPASAGNAGPILALFRAAAATAGPM